MGSPADPCPCCKFLNFTITFRSFQSYRIVTFPYFTFAVCMPRCPDAQVARRAEVTVFPQIIDHFQLFLGLRVTSGQPWGLFLQLGTLHIWCSHLVPSFHPSYRQNTFQIIETPSEITTFHRTFSRYHELSSQSASGFQSCLPRRERNLPDQVAIWRIQSQVTIQR